MWTISDIAKNMYGGIGITNRVWIDYICGVNLKCLYVKDMRIDVCSVLYTVYYKWIYYEPRLYSCMALSSTIVPHCYLQWFRNLKYMSIAYYCLKLSNLGIFLKRQCYPYLWETTDFLFNYRGTNHTIFILYPCNIYWLNW